MRIENELYVLRKWDRNDCVSLAENANNINIWNNVRDSFPHPYSIDNAREFIDMVLQQPQLLNFAIEVAGKAIGGVGLVPGNDVERLSAEIGYWIGECYWGQGITSKAVASIVEYTFSHTKFVRLFASVYDHNKASQRVLEKAGFSQIAILHKAAFKNGRIIDMYLYELVKL